MNYRVVTQVKLYFYIRMGKESGDLIISITAMHNDSLAFNVCDRANNNRS